jgi:hypothetical protein
MPQYRDEGHKTYGGKRYTKAAYAETKTAAKEKAQRFRKDGSSVRVEKDKHGYCIWERSKSKNA